MHNSVLFKQKSSILLKILLVSTVLWLTGCLYFFYYVINYINPPNINKLSSERDVVVIITGDNNRLDIGLKFLAQSNNDVALISGVGAGVREEDLSLYYKKYPIKSKKITLGYLASNTAENAIETKIFMDLHNYKSLILVTSDYHMPRASILFKCIMPEFEITLYPIKQGLIFNKDMIYINYKMLRNLYLEYNKFIATYCKYSIKIFNSYYHELLKNNIES